MKKINIDKRIKLIATKNSRSEIDYYIVTPDNERYYAFTKPYSQNSWDICKSGIRIYDLLTTRTKNISVMLLVAICGAQRSQMRFRTAAVRSKTAAPNRLKLLRVNHNRVMFCYSLDYCVC